jgi:hypothetical protein
MMNPTLGRNLGRWAQVYFTTPPEKREQAVVELLRELEGGNNNGAEQPDQRETHEPLDESPRLKITEAPEPSAAIVAPLVCPDCHHNYLLGQWFCGICGCSLLQAHVSTPVSAEPAPTNGGRGTVNHAIPHSEAVAELSVKHVEPDVQWLRESSLVNLAAETQKPRVLGKLVATVLLLLLVAFLYVQWRSQSPTTSQSRSGSEPAGPGVPAQSQSPASAAQVNNKTEAKRPSPDTDQKAEHSAAEANPSQQSSTRHEAVDESSAAVGKATPRAVYTSAASDVPASENGASELAAAEKYLNAEDGSKEPAQAAKLLWKAVGKQNKTAILLLADLYERGDGVPKSCDQAEVLLVAASKKGSTAAANRLRELQSSGCK